MVEILANLGLETGGYILMGKSGDAIGRIKNNVPLAISLFFTLWPILLIFLYLLMKVVLSKGSILLVKFEHLPIMTGWFEYSFWLGMFFLVAAIIHRRIRHKKGYPFLLVFLLFTVQAFIATRAKGAFLFVIPFVILYKLLGFDRKAVVVKPPATSTITRT